MLEAARSGALDSDAGVKTEVARLMASPRLETGMRSFFSDFLQLDTLGTITKDPTIYPKYSDEVAASAREETLAHRHRPDLEKEWRLPRPVHHAQDLHQPLARLDL